MNDRVVSVLEKYDIEVLRSWKGRGAILCETKTGIKILKEYKGSITRLSLQQELLKQIKKNGYPFVEEIISTREGELLVKDEDMVSYYLKTYREGRECNTRDLADCERSMEQLAKLHHVMNLPALTVRSGFTPMILEEELKKHNRELKKVRRFLKEKSQKTDFERTLFKHYEFFYEKAVGVLEGIRKEKDEDYSSKLFCHGDFQHHNILLSSDRVFFINFEKFVLDSAARDISLFLRKIMEKNNWHPGLGQKLLSAYEKQRPLSAQEKLDLYHRLSYPEKFWKIVNFYYNSSKTWIPAKNLEKLEKLLKQEEEKNRYLEQDFIQWVLH